MPNHEPTPELFKLYSEDDQNQILEPRKQAMDESYVEYSESKESKDAADREYDRYSSKLDGGSTTSQQISSNTLAIKDDFYGGGAGAAIDALFFFGSSIRKSHNDSEFKEVSKDYHKKSDAYHSLSDTKSEPVDSDKLNQELDSLYAAQKAIYNDYLANQAQIERSEKLLETKRNRGDLFGYGSVEDQIETSQQNLTDLEDAFHANIDLYAMAEDNLTEEQLQRFIDLETKMGHAILKTNEKRQAPPEMPVPPLPPPPPTPIAQYFVGMGAKLQCTFGNAPSSLVVQRPMTMLENSPMANIMDITGMKNIPPCGMCSAPSNPAVAAACGSPVPCTPIIVAPWAPGNSLVMVEGQPALMSNDKCFCAYGGMIQIMP